MTNALDATLDIPKEWFYDLDTMTSQNLLAELWTQSRRR